jgi:hypothetical protein
MMVARPATRGFTFLSKEGDMARFDLTDFEWSVM